MPYAEPEKRAESRRTWSKTRLVKNSGYRAKRTKYAAFLAQLTPGVEATLGKYASHKSASAIAWRINQGHYGDGFTARTSNGTVLVTAQGTP